MKYLRRFFLLTPLFIAQLAFSQDSTSQAGGLAGTLYNESSASTDGSHYLFKEWYTGSIRTSDDRVHDGIKIRYDVNKDELEYKTDSAMYRISTGIKEFNLPTGTDLYTFRNGYPAVENQTEKSFYRLMYDGNTKLLKKYTKPIKVEKASATTQMDPTAKLYILKDGKMNLVELGKRNSFLKLLSDEKNKMQYVIREEQLDFAGDDDLMKLLEEYDSYKAGRGGN
jgi:hypothetical protein